MKKKFIPTTRIVFVILIYLLIWFQNHHLGAEETIFVSPELEKLPLWNTLLKQNPLPQGIKIKYIGNKFQITKNTLTIKIQKWYEVDNIRKNHTFNLKEIESVKLIPMVPLLYERDNLSITSLRRLYTQKALKKAGISIIPISHLSSNYLNNTNLKALLVDNKTPFDKGYKLINRYFLKLENASPNLKNWFENIKLERIKTPKVKKVVWILAVGDIMLARGVDKLLLQSSGIKKVFGNTLSYLQGGDILIGNLECVASLKGHRLKNKTYTFHFNPHALKSLREIGFSYFSVTNNHAFDYGINAFIDTLKNLKKYHLGFSGAGENLTEASKPWVSFAGDTTVKILSAGAYPTERKGFSGKNYIAKRTKPGILWLNNYFFNLLKETFQNNSLNLVMVHGGVEWTSIPTPKQVKSYRKIIDSGADIVIGSHPHFIQGIEKYRGKLIVYSLGNFLFPGMEETGYGDTSIILKLGLYGKNVLYIVPIPVKLEGRKVRVSNSLKTIKRFYRLSKVIEEKYPLPH